ncbi:site-specific DNA-methyltransferase [Stenotrophomonas sp. 364]|uniref:site-specific DNA-methyltransferase n=1 Tax=Stenotrophomonas sp. 364 TaxID=2691571 RepID=UPI0013192266|nr:site-specific DNA-methyltransferase [Stenotrophomonas sp. 364]QHB71786.1 site-specific DNA-methyltransferase [Stenotrophomonas sp. 364]
MKYEELSRAALIKLLQDHDAERLESGKDGIVLNYTGRTAPWQIARQVKPRMCEINKRASVGDAAEEAVNELWDGENLAAMVTLYKYRGQVDLVLTDPPYNTGEDFRYNDKWDKDPNDPDMGDLVAKDDGSRHSKWLRFMTPRLWMMREMLKPGGVIAICIDHRELYRLGMLMDEIFHEENRLGIINWQKTTPKNQSSKLSLTTEYVLVYAKSAELAKTGLVERSALADARFGNIDNDALSDWKQGDLTGKGASKLANYAIQSPFTGEFHNPGERHWANKRAAMKKWLEEWGVDYEDFDIGDGRGKALALKGWAASTESQRQKLLAKSQSTSSKRLEQGGWPYLYWGVDGQQKPVRKVYKSLVRQGGVPTTFWLDDDEAPPAIDSVSWLRTLSGRSRDGIEELDAVVGKGHNFETVKPLRLIKKIIQIWCRKDGIVLDPFAGSGTTGHAVLELNKEQDASRRFILIEQGNDAKGDNYAKTLTADRIKRVITGKWKSGEREPSGGGFRYFTVRREKVDANAVNALAREEMMDLLLVSYWDRNDKTKSYLRRLPAGGYKHLFAVNNRDEGFFLVWSAPDEPSALTRTVFKEIIQEAKAADLAGRYHVYAALAPYTGNDIEFYQIPDKVLEHIGFNARADAYNNDGGMDAD